MTSKKLSQSGKSIDYEALVPGAKVYFYKPPTAQKVERRGRRAKHLDHYTGPATIVSSIGTRSFVIQYTDGQGTTHTDPATIVRSIGTRSFVIQYTDGQGTTRTYQRRIHDLTRSINRDKK